MKSENDIDKLFENNQGYPLTEHIPDDYWSDLDDKLDAEQIDKLFANNQGYAHVQNIPDDYLNDLDNVLDRTELDNVFKNNQGYPKGNKIPQDFLDDLESRLDDKASFYNRLITVSSLRKIIVATGIAATILYFLIDKKENPAITESGNSENNKTISGNNISTASETSNKKILSEHNENISDSLTHAEEVSPNSNLHLEQEVNNASQPDINNNKSTGITTLNKVVIESMAGSNKPANTEKVTTTTSIEQQQPVSKQNNKQQTTFANAYASNSQQTNKNVEVTGTANTEKMQPELKTSSKNATSDITKTANSNQSKIAVEGKSETVKNNDNKQKNADTLSANLLSNTLDTAALNNAIATNSILKQQNDSVSKINPDTTGLKQPETISLADTIATDTLSLTKVDSVSTKDILANNAQDSSSKPLVVPSKNVENNAVKSFQVNIGGMQIKSSFLSQNINYDTKRKQEETPIIVNDVSVLFNYRKYNIVISSGVNYGQWGEKINYNPVTDSVDYIVKYDTVRTVNIENPKYVSVDTKINPVTGKKADENTEVIQKNGTNKYSYLHIPVLVGYVIGKEKFLITPKIGCLVGVPLKNNGGYYINTDVNSLVEESPQKWILNYQAEIEFRYNNFVFSPYYRQNAFNLINSATTSNKYSGLGFQVGYLVILR